jgi:hypothetical protein
MPLDVRELVRVRLEGARDLLGDRRCIDTPIGDVAGVAGLRKPVISRAVFAPVLVLRQSTIGAWILAPVASPW